MLYLIQKEFKQILRNTFLPRIIIAFPIMAILVIPWVANMEIKDVNLAILDFDSSQTSKKIVAKISATSYFNMVLDSKNIYEARECLYTNQCDIILEFPNGFEEYLVAEHKANVGIYANAINSTKGVLGSGYLAQVIAQFASSESHSTPLGTLMPTYNPQILSIYRFNPNLDYKIFMIPALMVMVLTMLCGFLPALNIVSEKERGNIEQINVTPLSKTTFIMAKIIPYWIIGLVVLSLCFFLAFLVYGLKPQGGFLYLYLFAVVYIVVVTGMGLIISNYSNTMQQAMFVVYFFVLILILLSGLFTSVKSMPQWAEYLTYANPLKYFIESVRAIYLKGSDFSTLWENLLILCGFGIGFNLWAIVSYKKRV